MSAGAINAVAVDLPRVSGRHRNHALAAARQARAIRLVTEGQTYQQVADELGYSNRGTVHRLVRQALEKETVNSVDQLRRLEDDRLDALLHSVWDKALAGDLDAVKAAAIIVVARVKLFGLEGKERRPSTTSGRTVVLLPDERADLGHG